MSLKSLHSSTQAHPFTKDFKSFETKNNKSAQTPECFYSYSSPTFFSGSQEICRSQGLLDELKLERLSKNDIAFLSGDPEFSKQPFVTRYGGHQFGHWAGQLGDGRAHTLGRFDDKWDVQVKGSGPNPYSRSGDGYAVLRSSLREFLMSEYMHHLGVPTTRALNLMSTAELVLRDPFYDGNAAYEEGALVTRLAPSFLRFGHFQIFAKSRELENLKHLTQWTLTQHFPNHHFNNDEGLFEWFDHICQESLNLVIHWMRVGFVHGVLNTDNMSIHSLTIDYGPFSMMDGYDRSFTPNTTDLPGKRYSFENQPAVFLWNLERLAEALAPMVSSKSGFTQSLDNFKMVFRKKFEDMFQKKLGLLPELADTAFIAKTEQLLHKFSIDYSLFFSSLSEELTTEELSSLAYQKINSQGEAELTDFLSQFKNLSGQMDPVTKQDFQQIKNSSNPQFNLRNYMFLEILDDLKNGSKTKLNDVLKALETPYHKVSSTPELYNKRPAWAHNKAGSTTLSCSS